MPDMSKPTAQIDEVPEEEFKCGEPLTTPNQPIVHSTPPPQIKVGPLIVAG